MDFEVSYEVLHVTSIFELHIFDNETMDLLNIFEICGEMHFFFKFFQIKEILEPYF